MLGFWRRPELPAGGPLVGDRLRQGAVIHELDPERAGHLPGDGAAGELRAREGRIRGHRRWPVRPAAARRARGVGGACRSVGGYGAAADAPPARAQRGAAPPRLRRRPAVGAAPHVGDQLGDLGGGVRRDARKESADQGGRAVSRSREKLTWMKFGFFGCVL